MIILELYSLVRCQGFSVVQRHVRLLMLTWLRYISYGIRVKICTPARSQQSCCASVTAPLRVMLVTASVRGLTSGLERAFVCVCVCVCALYVCALVTYREEILRVYECLRLTDSLAEKARTRWRKCVCVCVC